jgi:hypothetical protein
MFLRWVCRRDDGLDLGIWKAVDPSQLRLPIDTHVARIARAIGLSGRRSPDRRFAVEATESLKRLCPADPVRYDFALARLGIEGVCPCESGGETPPGCPLVLFCSMRRKEVEPRRKGATSWRR